MSAAVVQVQEFGSMVLANHMRRNLRSFQASQLPLMRKAAQVVKREVVRRAQSQFRVTRPRKNETLRGKKPLGPLYKNIKARSYRTRYDVGATIGPSSLAFYGRYYETGLVADVFRHNKESRWRDTVGYREKGLRYYGHTARAYVRAAKSHYVMNIPRRPFLEPAIRAKANQVVEIMGESYAPFFQGASLA